MADETEENTATNGNQGENPSDAVLSASAPEFQPGNYAPYLRGGYHSKELGWWVPYYVGTLKSFNMRTGYGFLDCPRTLDIYKSDIYIHKSQVPVPWKIGAYVEFAVSQNSRGQPQATDVFWLPLSPSLEDEAKAKARVNAGGSSASTRKKYMGTLKSYSKMQGYGFITTDDVTDQHAMDVYLDRGQIPAEGRWQIGQALEFEISYNHRGQPQARNVKWDPIPKLPVETPNAGAGGYPAAQPTGPSGVNLMQMSGNRLEGQQGLRNLSKIHQLLRSDKSGAVKYAIELQERQESTETTDYISFVLDRLGDPQAAVSEELKGSVPMQLLLAVSKMLQKSVFTTDRAVQHLVWCEAIVPLLSTSSNTDGTADDIKFDNVISTAQENLQRAREAAPDPKAYDAVLAKLTEVAKGAQSFSGVAMEGPPGVPAA